MGYVKIGVLVLMGTLFLTACTEEKLVQKNEDELSVKEAAINDIPIDDEFTLFELTTEEREIYTNF